MGTIKALINSIRTILKPLVTRFQKGILGVSITRFSQNYAHIFATGMAFYAFFSLFPLLLLLVAISSFFLEKYLSEGDIFNYIVQAFPLYQNWIKLNLENTMRRRGAIGLVGLIALVWSASNYFNILVRGMHLAWPEVKPRHFVRRRMVALGMVGGIVLLLILSFLSSVALDVLSHYRVPMGGSILFYETFIWKFFSNYFPYIFALVIFWLLYYLIPNIRVKKRAAFIGALPASVAWNLLNSGFSLYIRSGLVRYEIVYGSLSTIVTLLFWIYISNIILLFGAFISASAQQKLFPLHGKTRQHATQDDQPVH